MADEKAMPTADLAFTEGQGEDTGSQEASSAPVQETPISDEGGDLTSTVEFTAATEEDDSSGADDNAQDPGTDKDDDKGKGKGAGEGDDGKDDTAIKKLDDTFQQSPRFKELIADKQANQTKIATLEGQIKTLTDQVTNFAAAQGQQSPGRESESSDYENILSMTDEDLVGNFEKDPKGFLANFGRQIYAEVMNTVDERDAARNNKQAVTDRETQVRSMYAKYSQENPDFDEMWNKGEIQAFQKANPGHTPMSAHQVIVANKKVADAEAAKTSAVEAAVKQAKEEATKAQQTKTHAQVISGGPADGSAASQTGEPAELQDTKKHGGLIRTLTSRSLRRTGR